MYGLFVFLGILSAGMLAGLMATLLSVFRGLWGGQSEAMAAKSFKDFLAFAGTNRILSTLSIMPVICAVAIALIQKPQDAQPTYAYAGGVVFLVFFFLWTAFFNLPIYREVQKWTDDTTPSNTRAMINRFHTVNTVRLLAALITSILFFLAV